jgi:hypothetical protein
MIQFQSIIIPMATLTVVLFGLSLIVVTMLWPLLLLVLLVKSVHSPSEHDDDTAIWIHHSFVVAIVLVEVVHLRMLYTDPHHLAGYRFLWLPVRRCILPVVIWVARMESIREATPTLYFQADQGSTNLEILLQRFRPHVRRRYRKMQELFQSAHLRHETIYSESALNAQKLLPILWEHECRTSPDNTVSEFIKRLLVVTLVPDGIFDLYYDDAQQLVAFQFSIRQRAVLHWFMYFCKDDFSKSGIWFHGILLAIYRGQTLAENASCDFFVNCQVHQTDSKQNAGLEVSEHSDSDLLSKLYPFTWTIAMPEEVARLSLWSESRQQ